MPRLEAPGAGLTLVDLFAGCGGLSLGFKWAGVTPVLGVEFEKHAAATYSANFGCPVHARDIAGLAVENIPRASIIVGGPPCQGFSGLGRRDPNDARNKLWSQYLRILEEVRPSAFVIENVPEFLKSPEYGQLTGALNKTLADYAIREVLLDAADFGVPQRRKRAFVIGSLTGQPLAPKPTHRGEAPGQDRGLKPWVSIEAAFAGELIPVAPSATDLPQRTTEFQGDNLPGPYSDLEIHVDRRYEPRSLERYRLIGPGESRFALPDELLFDCWLKKRTGTTDVLGRLVGSKPSVTIRTEFFKPEKGRYLHPQWDAADPDKSQDRAITHLEAAILQSFPREFKWVGSKVQIARQIGNAVPPLLAYEIAVQSVIPSIHGQNTPEDESDLAPTRGRQLDLIAGDS